MVTAEVQMINANRSTTTPPSPLTGMFSSASDVAIDMLEMGELQVQLAKIDGRIAVERSMAALALIIGGGCMTLACLPLMAFGIANCIAVNFQWQPWKAQILIGFLTTCIASIFTILGVYRLRFALAAFSRSSNELTNNANWLKQLVRGLKPSSDSQT
jgi:hypothetical protein